MIDINTWSLLTPCLSGFGVSLLIFLLLNFFLRIFWDTNRRYHGWSSGRRDKNWNDRMGKWWKRREDWWMIWGRKADMVIKTDRWGSLYIDHAARSVSFPDHLIGSLVVEDRYMIDWCLTDDWSCFVYGIYDLVWCVDRYMIGVVSGSGYHE